jgi:hypothetical protein
MLHTTKGSPIGFYWYTWETSHDEKPALTGEDAVFQPIGAQYGGGREYGLDELTTHAALPYAYDALFSSGSVPASSSASAHPAGIEAA